MDFNANVFIDLYQDDKVIAHREVHNIMCNTGRLFALKRLTGQVSDVSFTPLNIFIIGDQGTANPSDADSLPLTPAATQTTINHEVLRTQLDYDGISYSPTDPNVDLNPITLTVTSSLNSSDVDASLSYVGRISEAALISSNPTDALVYDMLVYTTFKAIPFDRNESVKFSVTWNIYATRS